VSLLLFREMEIMTDEPESDDDLDKRIAALTEANPSRRPRSGRSRGRPRNGFEKALRYADEVYKLRFSGRSSWRAIVEAAENNRKTPQHIAHCVKMVDETDPHEYLFDEPDYSEDPTCGGRWLPNDGET
jgi:hypothetical protein